MHERKKLGEAKYFYSQMIEKQGHRENFMHNLSAFLSSARSVLQYALNEAKIKPRGQQWYDNRMSTSPVLKFFKDKRDINIHTEPIRPLAHYKSELTDTIHISDSVSITLRDKNGNIKQQYSSGQPEPIPKESETQAVMEIKYKFDDWVGSEEILTLCQMYIQELENVIKDGVNKGFITG